MSEWEGEEGNVALKFFSREGGEGAGRRIKFVVRVEREGGDNFELYHISITRYLHDFFARDVCCVYRLAAHKSMMHAPFLADPARFWGKLM